MKKRLQGLICGVLIGASIAGGIGYAVSTTTLHNVAYGGVKIVVEGQELHPKDANGNNVEPLIYNGTTYLPVRAVADAFNEPVYWDGSNYTVYLGDSGGNLKYPTVELEDMISIAKKAYTTDRLKDNYGNYYGRAIYNHNKELEYLLDMKYSKFKGVLYVPEGEDGDNSVYLTIEADGKTIYTSPEMTKISRPVKIDVNVKGYNDVKIKFSSSRSALMVCLADAGFYQ